MTKKEKIIKCKSCKKEYDEYLPYLGLKCVFYICKKCFEKIRKFKIALIRDKFVKYDKLNQEDKIEALKQNLINLNNDVFYLDLNQNKLIDEVFEERKS